MKAMDRSKKLVMGWSDNINLVYSPNHNTIMLKSSILDKYHVYTIK